ncbi:MAG: hypothetical protein LBG80_00365 [Bacteroidales bacterium]|jgi:hypothetical protein|nr:hypothetical protein [Bacteroidales bacterium]
MKKYKLLLLSATLLFSSYLFSQKQEKLFYEQNFSAFAEYFCNEYGIICKEPQNFSDLNKYNMGWAVRDNPDKSCAFLFGPIYKSNDGECLLAYPVKNLFSNLEIMIVNEIKSALGLYNRFGHFNDTTRIEFYDYVSVVIGKKAREMFNADSIYLYDIPGGDSVVFLWNEELETMRKEKYPYCTGLVICKEGKFGTPMKLFFSEKGKMREDEYIEVLSKKIWYDDNCNK